MYIIKQQPEDFVVKEATTIEPGESGNFSYILMKKKNATTMDAVQRIADFLHVGVKHIGFAGIKDKNAVTEQYISVPAGQEKRLEHFKSRNIQLEFFGKGEKRISLGELKGNNFEIVVRDAKEPRKLEMFVNYFGEQRFSENNIKIGKAIIKGELEKAAMICRERQVMDHLKKNKRDYVGALKKLPKKLLTLYVNAYQSYLWNMAVEEYLKNNQKDIDDFSVEIIGFGTEFRDENIKNIYEKIMEKEKIKQRDFIVRRMPDLSSEGDVRKVFVKPENLKIENIDKKEYRLSFFLPKGCYATEFVRQMFDY